MNKYMNLCALSIISLTFGLTIDNAFAEDLGIHMVTIPGGVFLMGGSDHELKNRMGDSQEYPATEITVSTFELSAYETTFALWDKCFEEKGCSRKPDDDGFGRGQLPVVNISFDEITEEFIPWLNQKTGKQYRLPSEAEWEYAARGGTTTRFYTGDCITTEHENFSGERHPHNYHDDACEESEGFGRPLPVGSLKPNPFGLYDMLGNATETVEDCYYRSYSNRYRPTDGRPYTRSGCNQRIVRSCTFQCTIHMLRVSMRTLVNTKRHSKIGFRLAHSISQDITDEVTESINNHKTKSIIELLNLFDE